MWQHGSCPQTDPKQEEDTNAEWNRTSSFPPHQPPLLCSSGKPKPRGISPGRLAAKTHPFAMSEADQLVDRAVKKFTERDFFAAESLLHDALDLDTDHLYALNNLGHIHLLKKDLDSAAKYLDRAMTLDPGFVPATLGRAKVCLAAGDYDDALRTVQAARDHLDDQNRPDFHHVMGLVFAGKQDWDVAINFLEKCAQERPGDLPSLACIYQTCVNAGHKSRALDSLKRIMTECPDESTFWFQLLAGVRSQGETDRLPDICRQLAEHPGTPFEVINYAAQCCLDAGNFAYAALMSQVAMTREPDFERSQYAALAQAERFL